jgi:hypothetical protein
MVSPSFRLDSKLTAAVVLVSFASVAALSYFLLSGLTSSNQVNEVILEITHSGNFEFSITENGKAEMNSFYGRFVTTLMRPSGDEWVISVWAVKMEGNQETLSIELRLTDGTVLGYEIVSDPYGEITLSIVVD